MIVHTARVRNSSPSGGKRQVYCQIPRAAYTSNNGTRQPHIHQHNKERIDSTAQDRGSSLLSSHQHWNLDHFALSQSMVDPTLAAWIVCTTFTDNQCDVACILFYLNMLCYLDLESGIKVWLIDWIKPSSASPSQDLSLPMRTNESIRLLLPGFIHGI